MHFIVCIECILRGTRDPFLFVSLYMSLWLKKETAGKYFVMFKNNPVQCFLSSDPIQL